jgi:hypothetical protein
MNSKGLERQGREPNCSPPSCAQVKNGEALPPLYHTSSRSGSACFNTGTLRECITDGYEPKTHNGTLRITVARQHKEHLLPSVIDCSILLILNF